MFDPLRNDPRFQKLAAPAGTAFICPSTNPGEKHLRSARRLRIAFFAREAVSLVETCGRDLESGPSNEEFVGLVRFRGGRE
jgi:hypothetical protein